MISLGPRSERRRHVRLEQRIPLKISSDDGEIVTQTRNISCSGAYCQVNRYLDPMTKLKIHLLVPIRRKTKLDTQKITCNGVVVRTESNPSEGNYHIAIFFNDIQPKDSKSLQAYIKASLKQ